MQTQLTSRQMNRRAFLRNSAIATVAGALSATTLSRGTALASSPTNRISRRALLQEGDLAILNYALTLEHLEARAYDIAIGSGLLSGVVLDYFNTFGDHESTHVDTLTQTINDLGGTPVQAQASYNFPSFASQQEVLEYFQTVEELGAAAYLGQAPRLESPDLITAAVSIHNVEGQHAAILSDLIGVQPAPTFAEPQTMEQVLAVVGPILAAPDDMDMDDDDNDDDNNDMGGGTPMPTMPSTGRGGAPRRPLGLIQ